MMPPKPFTEVEIEGRKLLALPALCDPHVHFRAPGGSHKEDWKTASFAAIWGGVTTVCDMPNNSPSCTTIERLRAKKQLIDAELRSTGLPLRYGLYLGADAQHLSEISKAKGEACGIKVFMGGSTGDLLVDSQEALEEIFKRAADIDMVVAVHAEDETLLQRRMKEFQGGDVTSHSIIRSPHVAAVAVERAIALSAKYGTRLYLLHLSTQGELDLVRKAKREGVPVFAETTPHHLFLTTEDYATLGTFVQMNPPLREPAEQKALWEALVDGTIDTIGTDHAPHTRAEKEQPYGKAPSGIPGIDLYLPLLLNAVHEKRLTLQRLVELVHTNPLKLFGFPATDDVVLVDLALKKRVVSSDIKTKCGWSPYEGRELVGWPLYTFIGGQCITHKRVEGRSSSGDGHTVSRGALSEGSLAPRRPHGAVL